MITVAMGAGVYFTEFITKFHMKMSFFCRRFNGIINDILQGVMRKRSSQLNEWDEKRNRYILKYHNKQQSLSFSIHPDIVKWPENCEQSFFLPPRLLS